MVLVLNVLSLDPTGRVIESRMHFDSFTLSHSNSMLLYFLLLVALLSLVVEIRICDALIVAHRKSEAQRFGWTLLTRTSGSEHFALNGSVQLIDNHDGISSSENENNSSWLVCGDGDLSFSASIASDLADRGVSLVATVLEDQKTHHAVYQNSEDHFRNISTWETHQVRFCVNATNLSMYFKNHTFDRIQFNFPHWRGKANNKRNR